MTEQIYVCEEGLPEFEDHSSSKIANKKEKRRLKLLKLREEIEHARVIRAEELRQLRKKGEDNKK